MKYNNKTTLNMISTIGYIIIFKCILSILRDVGKSPSSLGGEMSGTKLKSSCHHGKHRCLNTHTCGGSPVQRSYSLRVVLGILFREMVALNPLFALARVITESIGVTKT